MATKVLTPGAGSCAELDARAGGHGRLADRALLAIVVVVTCLVSLPRFHGLMLADDEADARLALGLIGDVMANDATAATLGGALATPYLEHRLRDLRFGPEGKRALYHGYWIEALASGDSYALVAWPRRVGGTGRPAYLRSVEGVLFESEGLSPWSGLEDPPTPAELAGVEWRRIAPR